jgi:HEAT repeat protein
MTAEVDQAFAKTLVGDYDGDDPWEAVGLLRRIGTREVFERAAEWSASESPLKRARGADVLAQLGRTEEHPRNSFPDESFFAVSRLVEREKDTLPLMSGLYALGGIGNPLGIRLLIEHRAHINPDVRFAVAHALGNFADDPLATETLLALMQDPESNIRDWATFGLGVLGSLDSTAIREALLLCSVDADADVREEALVGLGKRKESRALPGLIRELGQAEVSSRVIEAADEFLNERNNDRGRGPNEYIGELKKLL